MTGISRTHARQILDSRGNPTVEVDVTLESGASGGKAIATTLCCVRDVFRNDQAFSISSTHSP